MVRWGFLQQTAEKHRYQRAATKGMVKPMTNPERRPLYRWHGFSVLALLLALAALHDISVKEPDLSNEYSVLAACVAWLIYVSANVYRDARARRAAPPASH